jgi:hypothetical protein
VTASGYGLFFGDRNVQFLFETKLGVSAEDIENTLSSEMARPRGQSGKDQATAMPTMA